MEEKSAIFAVKTTHGQERSVADMLVARAEKLGLPAHSVLVSKELKGYVFVETVSRTVAERLRSGLKHAKGVVAAEIELDSLEPFLAPKPAVADMEVGDLVELVAGPFRGERARIVLVDKAKEEATVELIEATVPIPVTVRGDHIRVIERKREIKGEGQRREA